MMADKKERRLFVLSEYEEEEQYLRDMARKGYLLEKVTLPGVYHFRKAEPVDMVYRLDFNPKKKEDWDSYLQMYRDYGWEYLQDLNEYSYFYKPAGDSDDENEIFSDNVSRIDMIERIYKRKMMPILGLLLCCLIPQYILHLNGSSGTSIAVSVLWGVISLFFIYLIVRCMVGFSRLRKKYDVEKVK